VDDLEPARALRGLAPVSIIGLGRVGLSIAVAFAERGFQVIGYDVDQLRTRTLETGEVGIVDPNVAALLIRNRSHLSAAMSGRDAALRSRVSYLIVPTPTHASGAYDVTHVRAACVEIGRAIKEKPDYHLVVVASTLLPGSSRGVLLPELERASGKTCGEHFGFCYSPIFVALNQTVSDFLNPNFGLVGEFDRLSGDMLCTYYKKLFANGAPVRRMTIENAELAKLAVNTFITTKIAFANMVADLCERLPQGDAATVLDILGADPRIGTQSLKAGLGFGGPCFPRDNAAMNHLAGILGVSAEIARATDNENRSRPSRLLDRLPFNQLRGTRVAVLGLAYKLGSNVVEGSQSVVLANELGKRGADVVAHDPFANLELGVPLSPTVSVMRELDVCLSGARVILVTLPDQAYVDAVRRCARAAADPLWIYDFWNVVGPVTNPKVTLIITGREIVSNPKTSASGEPDGSASRR
jgi:UDPglucose 6-dehydrogenase